MGTIVRLASELRAGDLFTWAGRRVRVEMIEFPTANRKRRGRYFTVSDISPDPPSEHHRLHYFDDEPVMVWR